MGFFDKVKSVAMKAKCGAGIHGGDYHNVEGKPKCYFEKTCPDCKEIIKKNVMIFYTITSTELLLGEKSF